MTLMGNFSINNLYKVVPHCDMCGHEGGSVYGVERGGAMYVMPWFSLPHAKMICLAMNGAYISGWTESASAASHGSPGPSLSLGEGESGIPNPEAMDRIRYGEQIIEDDARGDTDVVDRRGGEVET